MSGEYHHSGGTDRPDLPTLYIDAGPGEGAPPGGDEPDQPVAWKRLALTAIIVASAIVATAIVAGMRHEAELRAAAASEVNLVVGGLRNNFLQSVAEDGSVRINVDIFNAGERDVTITSLGFRHWEHVRLADDSDFLVAAGTWLSVPVRTRADCDTTPAGLEAEVLTDAGERSVVLDLPDDEFTQGALEFPCRSGNDELWYEPFDAEVLKRTGDVIVVRTLLDVDTGTGAAGEAQALGVSIVGVFVGIPGFSAKLVEAVDLHQGENTVDVAWRIEACADATTFTHGTFKFETEGDRQIFGPAQVSTALTVELARFAADVCSGDAG